MAVPLTPYLQFLTSNGLVRNGGKVFTYAAGTTTPKATYTSAAGTVIAANPVILNAAGLPDHGSGNTGLIWINGSYDFLVTNADGSDPVTMPNVSSFNTISAAGASYFQTFSGNGVQTTFSLSQPLGTDENAVLFFVDNGLNSYIANGDFATDTIWVKGAGWTIGAGVATATGAISTALSQTAPQPIVAGQSYNITYTITRSAGTITPNIGGIAGVGRVANGTYTETIIAGATQDISFTTAGFTGTVDNVFVTLANGQGWQVIPPTQFTLNNTAITFAAAPKTGVNNIFGLAFSTLVAAASASAASADASAVSANASAIAAANSATSITGTSVTSNTVATGSKSFTTQTGKNFIAGAFIVAASNSAPTNFMYGQVTSYTSGTGALVINVTATGGTGTFTDWNLSIAGTQGATGPAGTVSAIQVQNNQLITGTVGGTANAITFTPSPAVTSYASGQRFLVLPTANNTGATTINVSGLGAKNILKNVSGTLTALGAGDIQTGIWEDILYDGTQFQVEAASVLNSFIRVNTTNGNGSTNTAIRRWTTTVSSAGTDITYADSAANGGTFTINTAGTYAISYTDSNSAAGMDFGISLNTTGLTTDISSLATPSERLVMTSSGGAGFKGNCSVTLRLAATDVIRAHNNLATTGNGTLGSFTITRVQ